MELTSEIVTATFMACLYKTAPKDTSEALIIDGITNRFGFDPANVEAQKGTITALLMELDDAFMKSRGGGMSFLNACNDRHGNQWGGHKQMEELFVMGMAIKKVLCPAPREMWNVLPGGVPYYVVFDGDDEFIDPDKDIAEYALEMVSRLQGKEEVTDDVKAG